jgi:aromatic ring-opening dioxygenase catalytic subunit (LigB family)
MGTLVAGYATSHAFALIEPEDWDTLRIGNCKRYTERTGHVPTEHPAVAQETLEGNKVRYQRIRSAHDAVRQHLKDINPDVLIVVGDDQNENLHADNLPQFAVYVGSDYDTARRFKSRERHFRCHQALAHDIMEKGVARGFDLGSLGTFADNRLVSHAHVQVLDAFLEDAQIPTVLVFVNAIHYPATEPARCYALGQLLADIMRDRPPHERAVIIGSGGLSHFTAGYPWKAYKGARRYGEISEEFDRNLLAKIEAGEGCKLADLSSLDLMDHGNIELRSWVVVLGALGKARPDFTVYEPFYRGVMGMGVAMWSKLDAA